MLAACRGRGVGFCLVRKLLPNIHLPNREITRFSSNLIPEGCEVTLELDNTWVPPSNLYVHNLIETMRPRYYRNGFSTNDRYRSKPSVTQKYLPSPGMYSPGGI